MLAFAAYVPHPLMAVPDIGKEHLPKIRGTMKAYRELSESLYAAKIDTIICVSPHAIQVPGACTINQRPELRLAFTSFGNLSDVLQLTNDMGMGYSIRESVEDVAPLVLVEDVELDYGMSIPLFHLLRGYHPDAVRLLPFGTSTTLSIQQHYDLGVAVNRIVNTTTKRIAVIASGDLSHGATKHAPGGFIPAAHSFNTMVSESIGNQDIRSLLSLSVDQYPGISECGLRPLALLIGILDQRAYRARVLSFETPLGVGYLSVHMENV